MGALLSRPCVAWGLPDVRLPTGQEAARLDRWSIETCGIPSESLMEVAGRCAAQVLHQAVPAGPVHVVCGRGNNGGDGLVLGRTLARWGRPVCIWLVGRPAGDPLLRGWSVTVTDPGSDGWTAAAAAHEVESIREGVIVDALLGTGLRGTPRDPEGGVLRALSSARVPVWALDIPSGVQAEDGDVPGPAVQAVHTIAFGSPKLGTLVGPGRLHAGGITSVEIGFPPDPEPPARRLITTGWARLVRPHRTPPTHKNRVGRVTVVGGAPGMAGAAVLAARGALRAGAGLVQTITWEANRAVLQQTVPEALYVDGADQPAVAQAVASSDAVVCGPGLGKHDEARVLLDKVLRACAGKGAAEGPTLVMDADALRWLAKGAVHVPPGVRCVLTPHPGEMAALTGGSAESLGGGAFAAAEAFAAAQGVTVLLKGTPSLVADPSGQTWITGLVSSDLAAAGMGDVLAGVTGGLAAQGLAPGDAAALALHETGRAATSASAGRALLPSDVLEAMKRLPAVEAVTSDVPFVNACVGPPG